MLPVFNFTARRLQKLQNQKEVEERFANICNEIRNVNFLRDHSVFSMVSFYKISKILVSFLHNFSDFYA